MIIVQLEEGLGNQMFQYAAGKALALRLNDPLKLYFKPNTRVKNGAFYLEAFELEESFASRSELRKLKPSKGIGKFTKQIIGRNPNQFLLEELIDTESEVDARFFEITGDVFLRGGWEQSAYFESYEFQIRKAFTFKQLPEGFCKEIYEHIWVAQLPVAVYFIVEDVVSPSAQLTKNQLKQLDFYHKATQEMADKIGNPTFFIFTNVPDWIKRNFNTSYHTEIVNLNELPKQSDWLRLIMQCRHQIISSDSISWWGAWLNARRDKIVIQSDPILFEK